MKTAAALALVGAAGCAAYRPSVSLDDAERAELSAIAGRLDARGVRVVAPEQSEDWHRQSVVDALQSVGVTTYRRVPDPRPTDVTLGVEFVPPPKSSGTLALYAWTLGLVPWSDDGRVEYRVRLSGGAAPAATVSCATDGPFVHGWFALAACLRAGWSFGCCGGNDERAVRATRLGLEVARRIDEFASPK